MKSTLKRYHYTKHPITNIKVIIVKFTQDTREDIIKEKKEA